MMRRGMTLAERQELREQIRQRAMADAERWIAESGLTLRCREAGDDRRMHAMCLGESPPAGVGCLCTCHDNPGVTIERNEGSS